MAISRPRVFLDVSIGNEPAGRLVIELFADKTPKTCENFRSLCTGSKAPLTYALSPFHRIIDEFMIQGGDTTAGDGTGGASIYGGEFEDENLGWREIDASGLVCMANRGKGTNSSQFFITLEACPHLNNKHTIFGRIVSGQDTLARMAKVEVDKNDRPLEPVLVARCGELERKGKGRTDPSAASSASDRGRRPLSLSHSPSKEVPRKPKERRQSDQVVDETLRGRPKRRSESASRSHSRAVVSDSREESPTHKHKRKRSKSPSRGTGDREESPQYRRRRRSLPNQYHGDKYDGRVSDRYTDRGKDRDGQRHGRSGYRGQRYHDEADRRYEHREDRYDGRRDQYTRYPPRDGRLDDGRLGGDAYADGDGGGSTIKFKGRGSMKYREADRW